MTRIQELFHRYRNPASARFETAYEIMANIKSTHPTETATARDKRLAKEWSLTVGQTARHMARIISDALVYDPNFAQCKVGIQEYLFGFTKANKARLLGTPLPTLTAYKYSNSSGTYVKKSYTIMTIPVEQFKSLFKANGTKNTAAIQKSLLSKKRAKKQLGYLAALARVEKIALSSSVSMRKQIKNDVLALASRL